MLGCACQMKAGMGSDATGSPYDSSVDPFAGLNDTSSPGIWPDYTGPINWNAILPGVFKTAEQIGIMQTTPAGRYVATTPGGGSVVYQQPTGPGIPGLSLPGLTLPTGFSTGTLLLVGGAVLLFVMMGKR